MSRLVAPIFIIILSLCSSVSSFNIPTFNITTFPIVPLRIGSGYPMLNWAESTNETFSSISAAPGSVYNIMTMPVYVTPAIAIITFINHLDIPLVVVWKEWNHQVDQNSSSVVLEAHITYDKSIPFNLTYLNGTLITSGSVSQLTVDCRAVINIYDQSIDQSINHTTDRDVTNIPSISFKINIYRPCYQLQFRDRDQAKLFMTEVTSDDWIMSGGIQIGFNLKFSFTIPIQSFNFYAYSLVKLDTATGETNMFPPSSGEPPLLHLSPYWYSVTPRWNNQLQTGDQLTVAGSFAIGYQSIYFCMFRVYGESGMAAMSSEPVITNNTGMFQCQVPDFPTPFRKRVENGDMLRVVPGFLETWRNPPIFAAMTQVESGNNRFTLVMDAVETPWWSFQSWPIYVIIGVAVVIFIITYFFLLRGLCHHRQRSYASSQDLDFSDSMNAVSMVESHSTMPFHCDPVPFRSNMAPARLTSSHSGVRIPVGSTSPKPPPSEPIDMMPKILVRPSRFRWERRSRRNSTKELLLQQESII